MNWAYNLGYVARWQGYTIDDNPYSRAHDRESYYQWADGVVDCFLKETDYVKN